MTEKLHGKVVSVLNGTFSSSHDPRPVPASATFEVIGDTLGVSEPRQLCLAENRPEGQINSETGKRAPRECHWVYADRVID